MELRRGDRIHLAIPVSEGDEEDVLKQAAKTTEDMKNAYAAMGVTVVILSWNTGLTHPVVVSVFRDM